MNHLTLPIRRFTADGDKKKSAHGIARPCVDHAVVVIDGQLRAVVGGTTVEAGPGDCVVLPRGTERQLTAGPSEWSR